MVHHNSTVLGQPNLSQQPSEMDNLTPNDRITSARNEQASRLRVDGLNEVQLHLEILTSYFSHVLRHEFKNDSTAKAQAVDHWIESAKQWESAVPEVWKARLPSPPPHANAIQVMLFRHIRIQAMIETDRRRDLGIKSPLSKDWQDDIDISAFKKQLKLMKRWTRLFSNMLRELRYNFPLLEDALQDFRRAGGWDHLLGADGTANIDGL